jgi:DNA modification methylase
MDIRIQDRIKEIRKIKASELTPHSRNWRLHPKMQEKAMRGVLSDIGAADVLKAYYAEDGKLTLLDGHLRREVAPDFEWTVAILDFNEAEATEYLLTYDPLSAMAEADKEKMDALLRDISTDNQAVQEMLAEMAEKAGLYFGKEEPPEDPGAQIDKAEELREKWGTATGQLWQLGEHRLLCGDGTKAEDVARVMGGEKAAITFTSPPYNAGVSAQLSGNTSIDDNLYKDEYDDNKSQEDYLRLLNDFTAQSLAVSEYVFVNIQFLSGNKRAFVDYLTAYRDRLADVAIWDKGHAAPQMARRVMDNRFEFVLVYSNNGSRAIGTRDFCKGVQNIYSGNPQRHNEFSEIHAATFPIDFPEHFINTFTNKGEIVFEPFTGTGTTICACERLGRKCAAIDVSPSYIAVTLERWSQMTNGEPRLLD